MEISVREQLGHIMAAIAAGGAAGIVYDLIRVFIPAGRGAGPIRFVWAVSAAAVLLITGHAAEAPMGPSFLCAAGAGMCFYLWAVSPLIRAGLRMFKHDLHFYSKKHK